MAAEGRRAAAFDRAHHLQLRMAEMAGVGAATSSAVSRSHSSSEPSHHNDWAIAPKG
jgi:hypothetical protein